METLELDDIQGYIIRGYSHMMYSRYVLLEVTDSALAKKWISEVSDTFTNATHVPSKANLPNTCLNIAFTHSGLIALGMNEDNAQNFTREFREGMTTPHRQRLLGDFDSSSPDKWTWGGTNNKPVHAVLMIFGKNKDVCLNYHHQLQAGYTAYGLSELMQIDGQTLPNNKEHFGFRDGISQPIIKGSGRFGAEDNMIDAGEFLLGYKNEYHVYPDTPLLETEQGEVNLLPSDAGGSGKKDLGRNGSYLVMRQMQQDVEGYWNFNNEHTKNEDGSINVEESIKLAAKMMGRWPSGAPVVKFPDKDPGGNSDDNDFGYAKEDPDGLKCPFGSHLRRSNPRDSFEDANAKTSIWLTNRHRIIRRARLYGDPIVSSPTNNKPNGEVGLLFNCFNADISRQFEFIQYTWGNFPKVKQLYNDPDPITGVREVPVEGEEQNFTIQGCPVNTTVKGLKRFVTIKGGAYFFFPSITTIRYICTL